MHSHNEDPSPSTVSVSSPAPPHYVFETYPSHPEPKPIESLTGYLTRVAELNGVTTWTEVRATLLSPTAVWTQFTPTDFPLPSWSMMSTALGVSQDRLLATTCYFAGHKFDRTGSNKTLKSFLHASISSSLRYCPACLAEHGIRPLLWRFLMLEGCSDHQVHLLDHCGHCGEIIPLFRPPYSVRHCPSCQGDLAVCPAEPLPDEKWAVTHVVAHDLTQLLSRQPWEYADSFRPQLLGPVLQRHRAKCGWSRQQVAERLEMREQDVMRMEWTPPYAGKYFDQLYRYATMILGRPLHQLVQLADLSTDIVTEAQAAIQQVRHQGESVSISKVCEMLGIELSKLKQYPQVRAAIRAAIRSA
jgi:hypothetical protein